MVLRLVLYKLMVSLLFLPMQARAQEPKVTATLDTNQMLIGDQVALALQFTGKPGVQLHWPLLEDTVFHQIEILNRGRIDTSVNETRTVMTLRQHLLLTSFDTGFHFIPPIPFYYRELPDTAIRLVETRPHLLAVHTLAVDTTQPIKPIKGPRRVPLSFREILPWLLIGIAAAAVVGFLIYYIIKRRRREPVFRFRPRIRLQPHEVAWKELEKLRIKKLWQQGKVKEYYSELTGILRTYIEERFRLPALESTSSEILHDLSELPGIGREVWEPLGHLLTQADMVKFAKERPSSDQNVDALEKGISFVNQTIFHADSAGSAEEDGPQRRGDAETNLHD